MIVMGKPTFIDLFAAPGGLSLGFEMAGFRCLAAVDIDERAMLTFKHNFPEAAAIVEDITRLRSEGLLGRTGVKASDIDVIVGGPPCQGFSTVGRVKIASLVREGIWSLSNSHPRFINDPRNVLYREFVRMVADIKPKAFVMENVPGMMSYCNGKIVRQILKDFSRIGYRTEAKVLNAVWFGVPQIRKRIFFVGTRLRDAEISWPQPECVEPEEAVRLDAPFRGSGMKRPITVWEAIGDLPEPVQGRPGLADRPIEYDRPPLSDYQRWAREGSDRIHNHVTRQHSERDVRVFSMMHEGAWWKDLPEEIRKLYGYRDDIFHDKMKRLRSDRPSWTVVAHLYKDRYMYIHPKQPRTITVREAARLQSFPDRFIFMGSRTDQFRQVGNAVPPLLARAIAMCVRKMLEGAE
ncbi:MAG: DNA cytosine methyltransferase [Candidatus Hadarchaeales archaeon]